MNNIGRITKSKSTNRFCTIPNSLSQSKDLSIEEKGLMLYLLSLPEDWVLYKSSLHVQIEEKKGVIDRVFASLQSKGYIKSKKVVGNNGRFVGWEHLVFDEPNISITDNGDERQSELPILTNFDIGEIVPIQKTNILTNTNTNKQIDNNIYTASPKKEKKAKEPFIPPTEKESIDYFVENGFSEKAAKEAFAYYTRMEWKDRNGSAVKNWKQKYKSVWFKDENKALPKHKDEGLKGFDPKYAFDPKYRPTYSASGDQVIYQRRFGV